MNEVIFSVNNLWMMVATILVLIMHLGFATLESGLTQSKNTVNILFKNVLILPIGILTYTFVGFNLMYPGADIITGVFGFAGFGLSLPAGGTTPAYNEGYTYWTDFIFQGMFAATCATIVSGAVAERIKLSSFLIFSVIFVGLCYPIAGMWKWGGGFLDRLSTPFYDFAGSTIVHSVGGWAALAAIILLGPRKGKYVDGKIRPIPGHNLTLAVIGVFLLLFGWYGFNGGSVLSADPALVSLVFVTTSIAASSGAIGAFVTSYFLFKKHDITMPLNGILGGLVGITAGADVMSVTDAMFIGLVAGIIIPFSVLFFDKLRLDDPVGATSVHLVCGIWGTLAVGLFGDLAGVKQLVSQVTGIAAIGVFAFGFAFILMFVLKKSAGIRVAEKEEVEGLDIHEHGMLAYPDFSIK